MTFNNINIEYIWIVNIISLINFTNFKLLYFFIIQKIFINETYNTDLIFTIDGLWIDMIKYPNSYSSFN